MATDRQYRPAIPLDQAMEKVKEKSGTWFDPQVVEVLERRYVELERTAQQYEDGFVPCGFARNTRVERGLAPATGFEKGAESRSSDNSENENDFLSSIASARQEAQAMFELSQDLGNSLSLSETLSVLSMRLRKLIPYDSIAVFVNRNGWLLPEPVSYTHLDVYKRQAVDEAESEAGEFAEGARGQINKADDGAAAEAAIASSENCLIGGRVIGHGRGNAAEVERIRNVDHRAKAVCGHVRGEHPRNKVSAVVDGKDGDVWLALAAANAGRFDEVLGADGRSPRASNFIGAQRIHGFKGTDHVQQFYDVFMLDQADAVADHAEGDEVILRLCLLDLSLIHIFSALAFYEYDRRRQR